LDTYPDVLVNCGPPEFADDKKRVVTNPRVIIEVLSPSTELFDQGRKFQEYKSIPTLEEYLLVAQDRPWIEQFTRQQDGKWLEQVIEGIDEELAIPALGCEMPLAEIFARVEFPPLEEVIKRLRLFNDKSRREE
jgi:Uma2 family endonuclease